MAEFVTAEELTKQKKEFYKKHPESLWEEVVHSEASIKKLSRVFQFLLNTQNGTDIDDYVLSEASGFVNKLSGKLSGKDVLVIGTGTGREMKFATESGAASVEGVTMGKRNQLFAKEMVGQEPTICDMHVMPWAQESFDVIAGFQVLEHSYAPIVFLLECNRLLKTGGNLCLETPPSNGTSIDSWLHHVVCPTPRQMFCLFMKSGFKPVVYNDQDISGVGPTSQEEWLDDAVGTVYMEAIKMDPLSYERGDIRRFYEVLGGGNFSY